MKRRALFVVATLVLAVVSLSAAPTVSEKQDMAIFALGYYGWAIPQEALGNIDTEVQKVFVDLGRFNVIGMTERLSSGGLQQFIDTLKQAKQANFVMPDKYQFGEAVLTEAEFNKLLGAFIVAVPVVTNYNSFYNNKSFRYETQIKTDVTFIDVSAGGSTIGIAEIETQGTDKDNQAKSVANAIDAIPMQLQFEIRKIPAFQINTRVLAVAGPEVKLQLGQNMGIRKGDEYSVLLEGTVQGFKDEREVGLILIKDVGTEVSTGRIIYSSVALNPDVQLREIPRLGVDVEPYLHIISGDQGATLPGARFVLSRGFYGFRPYVGVQIPLAQIYSFATITAIPISGIIGGEYNLHLGRLTITPYGGAGITYLYVSEAISGVSDQTNLFPHAGVQGYLDLSFLVSRDVSIYVEGGADYWLSLMNYFPSFGGPGFGAGVSIKF